MTDNTARRHWFQTTWSTDDLDSWMGHPDSQKVDMRRRSEKFNACHEQRHVYLSFAFFLFDLFYVMQEKIQKILLSFWNSLILLNVCVINGTRPIRVDINKIE